VGLARCQDHRGLLDEFDMIVVVIPDQGRVESNR
jgi:hypothetical protein